MLELGRDPVGLLGPTPPVPPMRPSSLFLKSGFKPEIVKVNTYQYVHQYDVCNIHGSPF